jgi:hypothetical protein
LQALRYSHKLTSDTCKQLRDALVLTNTDRYNTAASFNQTTVYMGVFCHIAETEYKSLNSG